jgi:hypothetical protein
MVADAGIEPGSCVTLGPMQLPTLRDDDLVAEKAGFTDTGELAGSPRAGIEERVYAVSTWTAG